MQKRTLDSARIIGLN